MRVNTVQTASIVLRASDGLGVRRNRSAAFLTAGVILVLAASYTIGVGRAQQAQATDYMLDDSPGTVALYPGLNYHSYVAPKYVVPSLEELERRVGLLPPGTRLHWTPYKRDASGKPILFSDGQYDQLAKFCRDHKISLLISPSHQSNVTHYR